VRQQALVEANRPLRMPGGANRGSGPLHPADGTTGSRSGRQCEPWPGHGEAPSGSPQLAGEPTGRYRRSAPRRTRRRRSRPARRSRLIRSPARSHRLPGMPCTAPSLTLMQLTPGIRSQAPVRSGCPRARTPIRRCGPGRRSSRPGARRRAAARIAPIARATTSPAASDARARGGLDRHRRRGKASVEVSASLRLPATLLRCRPGRRRSMTLAARRPYARARSTGAQRLRWPRARPTFGDCPAARSNMGSRTSRLLCERADEPGRGALIRCRQPPSGTRAIGCNARSSPLHWPPR
jgi:hypothetical protein